MPFMLKAFAVCQAISGALNFSTFHPCIVDPGVDMPEVPIYRMIIYCFGSVLWLSSMVFWNVGVFQLINRIDKEPPALGEKNRNPIDSQHTVGTSGTPSAQSKCFSPVQGPPP